MISIGTETQSFEQQRHLTGVQRVVSWLNDGLLDELSHLGAHIYPMHTWERRTVFNRPQPDFIRNDRVLQRPHVEPEKTDACLFLDISHVNFPRLYAPAMSHIPKIFFVHDVLPVTHPEWFPPGAPRGYRLYLQQLLKVADHVICSSHKVRSDLQELGWQSTAHCHVVPLGSHLGTGAPRIQSKARLSLLYVSTVEPRKGHELLLNVFDRLLALGLDVDLTLVGKHGWDVQDGWDVRNLVERIRHHHQFGARLRWVTGASDHEVRSLASQATMAVIPPLDEGFGLFLEEALSMELKVVASDIPVFRERPHPNAYLADRTVEAFVETITIAHGQPLHDIRLHPVRTLRRAATELADLLDRIIRA